MAIINNWSIQVISTSRQGTLKPKIEFIVFNDSGVQITAQLGIQWQTVDDALADVTGGDVIQQVVTTALQQAIVGGVLNATVFDNLGGKTFKVAVSTTRTA